MDLSCLDMPGKTDPAPLVQRRGKIGAEHDAGRAMSPAAAGTLGGGLEALVSGSARSATASGTSEARAKTGGLAGAGAPGPPLGKGATGGTR